MKEITVMMTCELDEVEVSQRAQTLSLTTLKIDEVEESKATTNKAFKEELDGLRESARKLSRAVNTKQEARPVVCAVEFHSPVVGTKRIVRLDTGELYRDEPMTGFECQQNMFEGETATATAKETDVAELAARVEDAGSEVVAAVRAVLGVHPAAGALPDELDPLYDDAVKLVAVAGKASTSALQRELRIGYGRASALIERMAAAGLIGPADGSRPRELLKKI